MKNLTKGLFTSFRRLSFRAIRQLTESRGIYHNPSSVEKDPFMRPAERDLVGMTTAKFVLLLVMSLLTLFSFAFSAEKASAQQDCTDAGGECKFFCSPSKAITSAECSKFLKPPICCIPDPPTPFPISDTIPNYSVQEGGVCFEPDDCAIGAGLCQGLANTNSSAFGGTCQRHTTTAPPTPTDIPLPTSPPSTANCGNLTCSSNQTCISSGGSPYCLNIGQGGIGSYCGTLSGSPNSDACSSGYCDSTLRCANRSQPPTSAPPGPLLKWTRIASCPAPTTAPLPTTPPIPPTTAPSKPTSIPTSPDCPSGTPYRCIDPVTGQSQCTNAPCPSATVAPTRPQPPVSTSAPIPPSTPIPTSPVSTANGLCEGIDDERQFNCYSGGCPQKTGSICAPPNSSAYPVCRDRSQFCHITFLPTPTPTPSSQCLPTECGICGTGSICAQSGTGLKNCQCQAISSLTPTQGPAPTSPSGPTPTPEPGSVLLALSLTLEPIGRNREDLDSSVRLQPVTIELFDNTNNQLQLTTPVNSINQVEYDPDDGKFKRTINIGNTLAAGDYIVKIKVGNYLKRKYTRILEVKGGAQTQTFNVEKFTLFAGNTNNDTTIDTADYGLVVSCFGAKQNTASCADKKSADIDHNKRVDGIDYNTVLRNIGKSDE